MDDVFTYRGQNVDELSADQIRDALKQCIHELEQERRYKHTVFDENANVHEEKGELLASGPINPTQNTEGKS